MLFLKKETKQTFQNTLDTTIKSKDIVKKNDISIKPINSKIINTQKKIELFDNSINDIIKDIPEPNFFSPLEFPDNTSLELKPFTSDNVTDMYKANTISDLYNTINTDIYKQYKNNEYML